jgi:hypothetical protein
LWDDARQWYTLGAAATTPKHETHARKHRNPNLRTSAAPDEEALRATNPQKGIQERCLSPAVDMYLDCTPFYNNFLGSSSSFAASNKKV